MTKKNLKKIFIIFFMILFVISCSKNSEKREINSDYPIKIDTSLENKNLIFYYFITGESKITKDPFKIPESSRDRVLIVDTKLSPLERVSDKYVYKADLSKLSENSISYTILSRKDFESNKNSSLIIYTTNSCSICSELRKYLDSKKINYIDKNLEENPYYQKELAIKAQQSDRTISGVPVLEIDGKLYMGFQKKLIDENFK